MRVRLSGPAQADAESAFRYLNEHSPRAARALRSAIRDAIRSLRQMAGRGRPSVLPGLREIAVAKTSYVILYAVEADEVTVIRIRHTSQDPAP